MSATRFRLTPPELRENDIERACLDLLRLRGYLPVRQHSGTFKSADGKRWIRAAEKGSADYAVLHGRHRGFLLETKRPSGELKAMQRYQAETIRQGYGIPTVKASTARELADFLDRHEMGFI